MQQSNQPSLFETDSWFPHSRPVLTVAEVAHAFAMSENQVRALIDSGVIVAAAINCDGNRGRVHLRIERWSVIAWRLNLLAEQGQQLPFKESPQVTWWRAELLKRPKLATPCPQPRLRTIVSTTPSTKRPRKKKCSASKKSTRTDSTAPTDDLSR